MPAYQTAQHDQLNALRQYSCVRYYCTIVYFRNCLLFMSLAGVQYTLSALSMDGSAVLAAIFWLVPCGPCGRRDCSAYGGSLGCVRPGGRSGCVSALFMLRRGFTVAVVEAGMVGMWWVEEPGCRAKQRGALRLPLLLNQIISRARWCSQLQCSFESCRCCRLWPPGPGAGPESHGAY